MEVFSTLITAVATIIVTLISSKHLFTTKKDMQIIILKIQENLNQKEHDNKWYTCNLFYQATGLRLNYGDISSLVQQDNVCEIIYFISKYKGMYTYKKNIFSLRKNMKTFEKFFYYIARFSNFIFAIILIFLILALFTTSNLYTQLLYLIYVLIISLYLGYSLNTIDDTREASKLLVSK